MEWAVQEPRDRDRIWPPMRKLAILLFFMLLIAAGSGCASCGYLKDRGRDAKDIFTATAGKGVGAKVRVGMFSTGIFMNRDLVGIRGGTSFKISKSSRYPPADFTSILPRIDDGVIFVEERFHVSGMQEIRHKNFKAAGKGIPLFTVLAAPSHDMSARLSYHTQVEVAFGIHNTLRLGINIAELFDFIFGWTTLDLLNDDFEMARRRERKLREKKSFPAR